MGPKAELVAGYQLRLFTRDDVLSLYETLQANKVHLSDWKVWYEKLSTKRAIQQFIDENEQQFNQLFDEKIHVYTHPGFQCGIINPENKVVGLVGFQGLNLRNNIAALGYWIAENEQGKGLTTLAVKNLIAYGRSVLGINRFEIQAWIGNEKSKKVAERLGFIHECILKEIELRDGEYIDHHLYRLLPSDEWNRRILT